MIIERQVVDSPKGDISLYTLTNSNGAKVVLSSVGAGIVSIIVPDRFGCMDDVVLGYKDVRDYLYDGPCAGKIAGRYANRIARGIFAIDDTTYQLAVNCDPNHLHGGPEGFQNQIWDSALTTSGVRFSRISPDGEEGYPGLVDVVVEYSWNDNNELSMEMTAVSDKKTVINLTNHSYFNLAGESAGSVLNHTLWLNSEKYLPTDDSLVPNGIFADVAGTPMDFTRTKKLGQDINADFPALIYGKGYDNCWAISGWKKGEMNVAARLKCGLSGRVLEILTTQPAVQVYTGNWLSDSPVNKQGGHYCDYDGVAIECQAMPDAPNKPSFPSTILSPGETYREIIVFKFTTENI